MSQACMTISVYVFFHFFKLYVFPSSGGEVGGWGGLFFGSSSSCMILVHTLFKALRDHFCLHSFGVPYMSMLTQYSSFSF